MQVKIEKMVFGGQGLARKDGQVIFVWGGLPGEEVEIKVLKKKKNFIEGVVVNVLNPSPDRIKSKEEHFLSCSPWQTMSFEKENEWKKTIAEETYGRLAGIKDLNIEIFSGKTEFGYRNKMEYNFTKGPSGGVSLAFHNRGSHQLYPLEGCTLATKKIFESSVEIVNNLNRENIPLDILKSLVVRSDDTGTVAVLFVKSINFLDKYSKLRDVEGVKGWQIYYSNPLSPASVPTQLLFEKGYIDLNYEINGTKLSCGPLSFFQINPPVFEETLKDIGGYLSSGRVVDYFSGVGAIGLSLHDKYKEGVLIEENREASEYAEKNIKNNKLKNVSVVNLQSEKAKVQIGAGDTVIFDPPRTGLHKDLIVEMLAKRPKRIIYLSCGLDTHARDIAALSNIYKPIFWKLYNFFPHTPHIEGLCVLEII